MTAYKLLPEEERLVLSFKEKDELLEAYDAIRKHYTDNSGYPDDWEYETSSTALAGSSKNLTKRITDFEREMIICLSNKIKDDPSVKISDTSEFIMRTLKRAFSKPALIPMDSEEVISATIRTEFVLLNYRKHYSDPVFFDRLVWLANNLGDVTPDIWDMYKANEPHGDLVMPRLILFMFLVNKYAENDGEVDDIQKLVPQNVLNENIDSANADDSEIYSLPVEWQITVVDYKQKEQELRVLENRSPRFA